MLKGSLPLRDLLGSLFNGRHLRGKTKSAVCGGTCGTKSFIYRHKVTALQEHSLYDGSSPVVERSEDVTPEQTHRAQMLPVETVVVDANSSNTNDSAAPQNSNPSHNKGTEVSK